MCFYKITVFNNTKDIFLYCNIIFTIKYLVQPCGESFVALFGFRLFPYGICRGNMVNFAFCFPFFHMYRKFRRSNM